MPNRIKICYNSAADPARYINDQTLTFAIRYDEYFATKKLAQQITAHLLNNGGCADQVGPHVANTLATAYVTWLSKVARTLAASTDYAQYGLNTSLPVNVDVNFYNASNLSSKVKQNAREMKGKRAVHGKAQPPNFLISLDELLEKESENWSEIAFSRLFSIKGDTQYGYVARPGHDSIDVQMKSLSAKLETLKRAYGTDIPIVLLEDNVRYAKMLNWLIGMMEEHQIFKNSYIAGISTIFCCATDAERQAIKFKGRTVPLSIVVDYRNSNFDVKTPRDLMFDGFVVDIGGKTTRLPGIFMDTQKLFKLAPEKVQKFNKDVRTANLAFCTDVEKQLGIEIPISWFENVDALSYVIPMRSIMRPSI